MAITDRRVSLPGHGRLGDMTLFAEDVEPPVPKAPARFGFGLETRFDTAFVGRLALREKQVQQNYRPVIGIHKWFARRPGSVFRSLMLSEFVDAPLDESYWRSNNIDGVIADPFMGGGTTVFEALRMGLAAVGCDINPMAYWLVRQAVEPLDLPQFLAAAKAVWESMLGKVGEFYATRCTGCGQDAPVKYFLWAKTCLCPACGNDVALHPGYRVAEAVRHPREVYCCPACESLCEVEAGTKPECPTCYRPLGVGNARRGKAECLSCGAEFPIAKQLSSPPEHRLFAIEYRCARCYPSTHGRQFKAPDDDDRRRVVEADLMFRETEHQLRIPDNDIPSGDETTRLHRWGYRRYRDLFNSRQLLGLGLLLGEITRITNARIRHALATVFSDFLRYQNLLCRYDTYALKCQDVFSVHGYPVGLIVCEDNLPGIPGVGSGSFIHFVEKYAKAKDYTQRPYETRTGGHRNVVVRQLGERIEAPLTNCEPDPGGRSAWLSCVPSQDVKLAPASLDGVFTDPPYFDNVQYAELMDFCFVWLRHLLGDEIGVFERVTTRAHQELTGNDTLGRGLESFTSGLSEVFCRMAVAMKPGAPLAFTYHHNDPLAYVPLVVALLDGRLTCTAVLPVPAEMAASLHIAGTKSSILDSVFVCRDRSWVDRQGDGTVAHRMTVPDRVAADVNRIAEAGYRCTDGDIMCLRAGHIASDAVRVLGGAKWRPTVPLAERLRTVSKFMHAAESGLDLAS